MKKTFLSFTVLLGILGCAFLILPAIYAPFIANGRPLLVLDAGKITFPFLQSFFAPDSNEKIIEIIFNFSAIFLPLSIITYLFAKKKKCVLKTQSVKKGNVEFTYEIAGKEFANSMLKLKDSDMIESMHMININ